MRTYKQNVTELDRGESVVIRYGNHVVEIEAINDDDTNYLEVRVPSGHYISNMVQRPLWRDEMDVFFVNPEWFKIHDTDPGLAGGLQELAGPIRFITFIQS